MDTELIPSRVERRRRARRRLRVKQLVALAIVGLLAPVLYSYTATMLEPSSLPLGIRSVEWVRAHGGAWFVNDVERFYYSWRAPKKGGPTLTALPSIGHPAMAPEGLVRPSPSSPASSAGTYRPQPIAPVLAPALPGEGAWQAVGPKVAGAPPVLVTTFRSETDYPRIVAYVAWMDRTRTQLALYPGRYEPPSSLQRGPLEVPQGQRWRLLATFNSGFTYKDGHGGFAVNGETYTPFTKGLGTLVVTKSGHVDVVSWNGGSTVSPRIVAARQNLPLIVSGGKPNPNLSDGPAWGYTLGNAIRVWRSGVGIDKHGNLIYAAADYQTVSTLADILIRAGAVRAMELDINAEWPSFITYGHFGARDPVKLVPNGQQPSTRYLVPDDRDFFSLYRRVPGTAAVPFK